VIFDLLRITHHVLCITFNMTNMLIHTFHPIADERVWAFRYKTTVTAFGVVSARYVVLLDTLVNGVTAQAMVDALREPLQTRQLLVINTHADWDHCYGNMVVAGPRATHPAPIIAHRLCRERMLGDEARAKLARMQAQEAETFDAVELVPPTITFDGSFMIDGGDITFELIHTPGHTIDHVSIFIPELRMLFPGDGAETPLPFVPDAAALPVLRASLERLHALHAETVLYCHADSTGPDVIVQNIAYFNEVERRMVQAVRAYGHTPPHDNIDLETLISFPFDDVPGVDQLDDEERAFYRPAHQATIKAMIKWVG
jgi:glyoxylase-like metal-dependent hydrolase (beta-lactamase superfamily II)